MPRTKAPSPDPDRLKASRLPPVFANRFFVLVDQGMFKLSFASIDLGVGDAHYHTSIALQAHNAVELAEMILSFAQKVPPSPPAKKDSLQ